MQSKLKPPSVTPSFKSEDAAPSLVPGLASKSTHGGVRMGDFRYTNSPLQAKAKGMNLPSATYAATTPIKRARHALPGALQSGIRALSGLDVSDVTVHRNSAAPAQVNALAFAQGREIHLAPGQENHLPHEAWHVVQQAQGRVQSTSQVGTVAINDNSTLEREADAMGQRAMHISPSASGAPTVDGHDATARQAGATAKVMQLIATQITLQANGRIDQVIIRGRPARVFSNSMGDHTTAFVVHQEGLNIALQDCTIEEAIDKIETLMNALRDLPGYPAMQIDEFGKPHTSIGQRFSLEQSALAESLAQAKDSPDQNVRLSALQTAINAYLSARELVPFSTINVGEKSKGKAGRGHGESAPASILSSFEREDEPTLSDADLVDAAYRLFDFQSAGMLASEKEPDMYARMTGGLTINKLAPADRLTTIWEQHIASIRTMFPKVFAKIGGSLDANKVAETVMRMEAEEFSDRAYQVKTNIDQATWGLQKIGSPKKLLRGKEINMTKVASVAEVFKKDHDILRLMKEMECINKDNDDRFASGVAQSQQAIAIYVDGLEYLRPQKGVIDAALLERKLKDLTDSAQSEKPKEGETQSGENAAFDREIIKQIEQLKRVEQGSVLSGFSADFSDTDTKTVSKSAVNSDRGSSQIGKEKPTKKATKGTTLVSRLLPMSIQIQLGATGNVTGMKSDGRPASPFSHSMGAHSTAWVVHLDRVARRIAGKSVNEAVIEMKKLGAEVLAFDKLVNSNQMGDNAKILHSQAMEALQTALDLEGNSVTQLQSLINAILSFYNLIPGVSRDKIDTGGKGEGKYRKILRNYEDYGVGKQPGQSKDQKITLLNEAFKGMYDGRDTHGRMRDNHHAVMMQAYPTAYQLVFFPDTTEPKNENLLEFNKRSLEAEAESEVEAEDAQFDPLTEDEKRALETKRDDEDWLASVNNCLINAITDAAGINRATIEDVIAIRTQIGAPVGEMLFASTRVLNIILVHFNLQNVGVAVINVGSPFLDFSSALSNNPLYIYHNGVNHFDALPRPDRKLGGTFVDNGIDIEEPGNIGEDTEMRDEAPLLAFFSPQEKLETEQNSMILESTSVDNDINAKRRRKALGDTEETDDLKPEKKVKTEENSNL